MKRKAEIIFSLVMVLVFSVVVYQASGWRIYAKLLPWVVGLPMLAMALWQLSIDIRKKGSESSSTPPEGTEEEISSDLLRTRTLTVVGYLLGLFLGVWLLGFSIAIPIFMFLYLKLESGESWWLAILLSAVAWGCIIGLFEWALDQPFPAGILVDWVMELIGAQ